MFKFSLVKLDETIAPVWLEHENDFWWKRENGQRTRKYDFNIILETQEAEDFEYLDWSKCNLTDNTLESGWLSPEGKFYGCHAFDHDRVARLLLKMKPDAILRLGWVHITDKEESFSYKARTQQQIDWMYEQGFTPNRSQKLLEQNNNW